MTTDRTDRNRDVIQFQADLLSHLMSTASTDPVAIDAMMEAFKDGGAAMAFELIASLMPKRVDGPAWSAWAQGGPVPEPVRRVSPDYGRTPKANGQRHMALAQIELAKGEVAKCTLRLMEAEEKLRGCERDLEAADDRIRNLAILRLFEQIAKEMAVALMMGPVYAIPRAISPYLQVDEAFEAGLTPEQAEALVERRKARRSECMEILDLLDRYAGDERLEINLQRAILKAVRDHNTQFEIETDKRRAGGIRSTEKMKRRALRRRSGDMKTSVHPAAPLADVADVFEAFDMLHDGSGPVATTPSDGDSDHDAIDRSNSL